MILLVIILGVTYRLLVNFWTPLMPKINGAYYLVQGRSVAETGKLAFSDTPILFYLQGYLARFFSWVFSIDITSVIVAVSKLFDSIIPTLISIPVYFIAFDIIKEKWSAFVVALFSVLFISPIFMTGDFQKNSFGLLLVAVMLFAIYKDNKYEKDIWIVIAGICLVASYFTHIGAFAVGLLLAGIMYLNHIRKNKIENPSMFKILFSISAIVLGVIPLIYFTARMMGYNLIGFVAKLFAKPAILGYTLPGLSLSPFDIFTIISLNILAITTLVYLKKSWDELEVKFRRFVASCTVLVLLLCFPFISIAYLGRLSMMAYIPAFVCLAFVFSKVAVSKKKVAIIVVVALILIPTILAFPIISKPSIPVESFSEFESISEIIKNPQKTLIVTKHGLEWWASWSLKTPVVQDLHLTEEILDKYETVLFLVEGKAENFDKKSPSRPGIGGSGKAPPPQNREQKGPDFEEVRVPPGSKIIRDRKYFQVYKIRDGFQLIKMEDHFRP